jgi:hypothetical protein
MATNAARLAVFDRVPAERVDSFYASEILDAVTCGPCAAVDGLVFESLTDAHRLYPTGGYVDCAGGPRCAAGRSWPSCARASRSPLRGVP